MKIIMQIVKTMTTIAVPVLLIMTSIRVLINPFFLDYEYGLPAFPQDEFGFTTQDRLHWGKLSLTYLTNDKGIEFLSDLKFDNGKPIYNERELGHMLDVKNLVQLMIKIWIGLIIFIILMGLLALLLTRLDQFWRAIATGGWVTIGLIFVILAAVLINFDALFTGFHLLFFTGDTWLFYMDDTLIRLFPEKLWSDAFTFMGIFTLTGAILSALGGARLAHRIK
jgi:integral membrane protein (TIGR01906 family)